MAKIDSQFPPPPRATVKDFVDHIDYAVKLIGVDHIGISSDFDGGGGVDGWSPASETFNVTLELVRRGYTEQQIAKMWSGNLLRVMREVEKVATGLQKSGD
jgi:membrane dipeptidase